MDQWQPIKTAPLDGTLVLIWCPDYAGSGSIFVAQWETDDNSHYPLGWIDPRSPDFELVANPDEATHWMHLPKAPQTQHAPAS